MVDSAEETDETIEYNVNIPKTPFTSLETYSLMFEEVCNAYNLPREGSRAMRHLINKMLADTDLGMCTSERCC